MRILVLTRSYPEPGNLYQYPFVHRRVIAYLAAGHDVLVFRLNGEALITSHNYEGVTCHSGNAQVLLAFLADQSPDVLAIHGFSEEMHAALVESGYSVPACAWLHGSEIPAFFKAKAEVIAEPAKRTVALAQVRARRDFWNDFLCAAPPNFSLVFVSNSAVQLARQDMGERLTHYAVVHNPIDTDLFAYHAKAPDQRFKILMIRPFDSWTYGNDMAVAAIVELSRMRDFESVRFSIFGDGPLFDETVAPLKAFNNVRIQQRFLTQAEISELHRDHGIFLVPTRLDTQGVSRDEAMASGLVPVTNYVSAVPEFVDSSCAALAAGDDSHGIAQRMMEMIRDPELFLSRSRASAERVRRQSGQDVIIPAELSLLAKAANA